MTWAPQVLNILATVLLPVATPPVSPTTIMARESSMRPEARQQTGLTSGAAPL